MTVASCILKVGGKSMVTQTHDEVVEEIKAGLAETNDERSVNLKLSLPSMERLAQFRYEGNHGETIDVHERTTESPYVFSIPAQVCVKDTWVVPLEHNLYMHTCMWYIMLYYSNIWKDWEISEHESVFENFI